ncbi:MAG: hypothetical protein ACRDFS_12950 [Chloroflexota bacterium]
MNTTPRGPDEPIAWSAIAADTPVFSRDGEEIGGVHDVLGSEDIFHGLVVKAGPLGREKMIPAEDVGTITNKRIDTNLDSQQIRELPDYLPEDSYQLGIVGLFRKHVGWVPEGEHDKHGKE